MWLALFFFVNLIVSIEDLESPVVFLLLDFILPLQNLKLLFMDHVDRACKVDRDDDAHDPVYDRDGHEVSHDIGPSQDG